jgi:hypothetical protein
MPSAAWYFQRLKAMSFPEVIFRLHRSVGAQLDRFSASAGRIPASDTNALYGLEPIMISDDAGPYVTRALPLLQHRIRVFDLKGVDLGDPPNWNKDLKSGTLTPSKAGKLIDYRDESVVGNIKYVWEASRHLMLPPLAQAYRLTGKRVYLDCLVRLIDSWIAQCPYPRGVHWCSSLEVGIRLINWSIVWRIVGGLEHWEAAKIDQGFIRRWLDSIYRHIQFISGYYSRFSSANNHLIGEAAAVYIGTTTWPAWRMCGPIRDQAREILLEQVDAQTHEDGVNKEQAVAYQQFVLDFFILAGLAARQNDDDFPQHFWVMIERMLEFISSLMNVAGDVPMIGDADDGFVVDLSPAPDFCNYRSLLATGSILVGRGDFADKAGQVDEKTRWLIPEADREFAVVKSSKSDKPLTRVFPDGGYYVLGARFEKNSEVRVVLDAGPLGLGALAAHGHADALSFTMSVAGIPVFIDPGTYAYHTDRFWRDFFRGTSAHNTVRIDTQDQSEIGGNFLWSRHADVRIIDYTIDDKRQFVAASHDGYSVLSDPVQHIRRIEFDRARQVLQIEDQLICKATHDVEIFFHIPDYVAISGAENPVLLSTDRFRIRLIAEHDLHCQVFRGDTQKPLGWVSYRFDHKQPAKTLRYAGKIDGSTTLVTNILIEK